MVILTFYQLDSNNKCHRWDISWSCKQLRTSFSPEREHHNIFCSLYAHNDNQTNCALLNKTLFCTLYMKAQSPVGFHPRRSVCCSASIIFVNKSYDLALACVRRREMDKSGIALPWWPHKWLWGRTMASSTGPSPESLFLHHQHLLPHIQNYGMFCRLCFFLFFSCRHPLWKAADGRTHECTVDISQLLFHKKHQCLIYFGLFSKYIISIVQVSEDGARMRTVEAD